MSPRRVANNGVLPPALTPAARAGNHASVHRLGIEATAELAAAVEADAKGGPGSAQRLRRGASVGGPAAVGSWNIDSVQSASPRSGAAATHSSQLLRSPEDCQAAGAENLDGEVSDDDVGADSDEAHQPSLLERIAVAEACVQSAGADAGAGGSARFDGPSSSGSSDEVHSTEHDSIAAVALGLGVVDCPAPNPAVSPDAAPETAAELLSELKGPNDAAHEVLGTQGHSGLSGRGAVTQAEVLNANAKQRQAQRFPTKGGPNAVDSQLSEDATQLPAPSAAGSMGADVRAACVPPAAPAADAEPVSEEPLGGARLQSSTELSEQPALNQMSDPAAPDTPPSKPPPLAATVATADDAEEQARNLQQACVDDSTDLMIIDYRLERTMRLVEQRTVSCFEARALPCVVY